MKHVIHIIAIGAAALVHFSTATAEAPVFDWEKTSYQAATSSGKTRAEVIAELHESGSSGVIAVLDRDYPANQKAVSNDEGKTRAQVRAEAIEARRLGLVPQGDTHMPMATPAQLAAIELAGLRAFQIQVSSRAK